jgi:hypothetical protein
MGRSVLSRAVAFDAIVAPRRPYPPTAIARGPRILNTESFEIP